MTNLGKMLIRISAFVTKEIREVLRQPWLVVSLILGPFGILALFGIGYRGDPAILRTVVVAPNDPVLVSQVEEYVQTLGRQLQLAHVEADNDLATLVSSEDEARSAERVAKVEELLARYQASVVASFPPDAGERIQRGEAAPLLLYYDTIDPVRDQYVASFGLIYTYEVNRRVLTAAAGETQGFTGNLGEETARIKQGVRTTREAVLAADRTRASNELQRVKQSMDRVTQSLEAAIGFLSGVQASVGGRIQAGQTAAALQQAQELRSDITTLQAAMAGEGQYDAQRWLTDLDRIERAMNQLEQVVAQFNRIPPQVLASPFRSVSLNVAAIRPDFVTYYAPGVLALLLQHLAVSMAALSLVRERLLGALEVFRVGPLTPVEALLGKYISYTLLCMTVGVVLILLLVYGLGVPLQGAAWPPTNIHLIFIIASLLALIIASLGIGFVISAISSSDSQAVQLSMIVLLASIFFSGFFLPLENLIIPANVVAYSLPVTYAIRLFQAMMLRGEQPWGQLFLWGRGVELHDLGLWVLSGMALVMFVLALLLFKRQFKGE